MSETRHRIALCFRSAVEAARVRGWLADLGHELVESLEDDAGIALVFMDAASAARLMGRALALKNAAQSFVPIVVGVGPGDDATRWLDEGADDVLHLPATRAEWRARLANLLRLRGQARVGDQARGDLHRAMLENAARLQQVAQSMPLMMAAFDDDGTIVVWSDECERVIGYPAAEIVNNPKGLELLCPDAAARREMISRSGERGSGDGSWECDLKGKDGTIKTVAWSFISDRLPLPGWARWAIGVDVTAQRQAQRDRDEARLLFEKMFELSPVAASLSSVSDRKLVDLNKAMERLLGFSRDELLGVYAPSIDYWVDPAERQQVYETLRSAGRVVNHQFTYRNRSGELGEAVIFAEVIRQHGEQYVLSQMVDITDRKRVEEQLRRQLEHNRQILHTTMDGYILADTQGVIKDVNPAYCAMVGYTRDELLGMNIRDIEVQLSAEEVTARIEQMVRAGRARFETRHRARDGRVIDLDVSISILQVDEPLVAAFVRDVTARRKAEQVRRVLETAIGSAMECIIVSDADRRVTYVNRAFEVLTGWSRADAVGRSSDLLQVDLGADGATYQAMLRTTLAGRPWHGLATLRNKDGDTREVDATVTPVLDADGRLAHFVSVVRDVTRERELERRVQQSQRLEAIGTLAGGIAHDFNNLLMPMMGYAELCKAEVPPDSKASADLDEVLAAAQRATDLVRQILSFSRRSDRTRSPLRMAAVVDEALKLLRATLPSNIIIQRDIAAASATVLADPTEIHQVMLNLCTNALHAMPDGGSLTVGLKVVDLDAETSAMIPNSAPGRYLRLSVEDTGHGVAPDRLEKIFDPYYTTREEGRGSGLGLAVTHGIVTRCGGAITVYSEEGKGTRFCLYFPVSDDEATQAVQAPAAVEGGDERILFVDDDPTIIGLGRRVLERGGYTVTTCQDPVEALELFERAPADYDLVITDMMMPGMTGDRLAVALLELRPELPIVICTGFSERMDEGRAEALGIRKLLSKPVTPGALSAVVREVLDRGE